jgi:hypothetical protein
LSEFDKTKTKYELTYDAYPHQGIEFEKIDRLKPQAREEGKSKLIEARN